MKRVFHHINRTLLRCLEVAGVLALVLVLAWLGLLWRLSQGPLDVSPWVTGKLEQAFGRDINGFVFKLGGAQLTWGGRFEPFEFEMRDVKITRDDDTPVLDVKKLHVQLSKRNLVFGRIVPRLIRVQGPALRVIRQEDGRFSLNVGAEAKGDAEPLPAEAPVDLNRQQLVRGVLQLLQENSGLGLLDGLREVTVSDAALLYEDKVLGVHWLTRNADVSVVRGDTGISATSLVSIDMDDKKKATVRAEVKYDWETQRTEATAAFTGLIPSRVAQTSDSLKQLSDINMTFSGSLSFGLDADFKPSIGRFALGADAGTFNAFGLYKEPVAVKGLYASGKLDTQAGRAEISELKIDLGGPQALASVKIETEEGGIRVGTVKGALSNLPIDRVKTYWPDALTPDPRLWVTTHLSQGMATKATIDMALAYDAKAEHKISLRKLGGKIDFNGVKVDYFPPLLPVTGVAGSAKYDHSSFHIESSGGKIGDMKMTKGKVVITDLDKIREGGVSKIDVTATVTGPMKTGLKLLDSKPLEYPAMLGLKSEGVGGQAETQVSIKFPIRKALKLNDIKVKAEATLEDVLLKDVVAGMDLTGGPMQLVVDSGSISVKGKGKIGAMQADFDWLKNFSKDAPVASRLTASLALDAASLAKFGVPEALGISGTMPATIDYTLLQDKSAVLSLKGDMKPFGFTVPMIGFSKAQGVEGAAALTLALQDNQPQRIAGLDLSGGGIAVKGNIDFTRDGMGATLVKKASIKQFLLGENDVAIEAEPFGKGGYSLKVTGRQIDASPLFRENVKPNSDAEAAKTSPPLRLSLNVNRLITGPERTVERVKAVASLNAWRRIEQLELDAVAEKPLTLRYMPGPKGHTLKFEAQDAGAALTAFGFAKSIRGGNLRVDGRPQPGGGPRDMVGTATLNDFRIKDAPVILSILKLVSIIGIPELMTSQSGVAFKKARVDFTWTDKGPPGQHENVRILSLKDGKTFGSSLGITFEGNIDNWKNAYDLEGTIVPASNVAKFLNIIPIVGTVLTAGGEGIFAATYKVRGTKENPQVSANPLSVLAPGILRKIFFR